MSPTQHKYKATNVSPMIEEIGQRAWLSCSTDDPNTCPYDEPPRHPFAPTGGRADGQAPSMKSCSLLASFGGGRQS
jgi:hypothetical protein